MTSKYCQYYDDIFLILIMSYASSSLVFSSLLMDLYDFANSCQAGLWSSRFFGAIHYCTSGSHLSALNPNTHLELVTFSHYCGIA
jgi:hypothetical protein